MPKVSATSAPTAVSWCSRPRSGPFLPIFDELGDPAIVARLSAEAAEAGGSSGPEPVREVRQPLETVVGNERQVL
jgi:hypothetical protein